jgi:hypothetical protein
MSSNDFEALRPMLGMSPERIESARLALVDGLSLGIVAKRYGVTRQSIGDAVSIVYRTFEKQRSSLVSAAGLPEEWVVATLVAPPELIDKFRQEIEKAKSRKRAKVPKTLGTKPECEQPGQCAALKDGKND